MVAKTRVLVVDDQRFVRKGIRALFSLFPGIEVVGEAANGRDALTMASNLRPDVVLMDISMPIMDGLEATRRIKSRHPAVRVVLLTLHAEREDEGLAAGADAFLVKDGSAEALRAAVCAA